MYALVEILGKQYKAEEGKELVVDKLSMEEGSSYEIEKKGISYTYDTVRHIYDEYALKGKLGFLMGDDLLHDLDRWYNYDALKELVTFVCFTRGRDSLTYPGDADIIFYDVPPYKASSTDVRDGDYSELTTDVRRYIEEHGLYNS